MGPRPLGRITRQWWGTVHFRIGGRGQQRPNKGFDCKTLGDFGKNLEFLRWNKFLRRQTIAQVLNYSAQNQYITTDCQLTTDVNCKNTDDSFTTDAKPEKLNSWDIYMVEKGEKKLSDEQIKSLESFLAVKFTKKRQKRLRI
ncbi:conserved Plasmodium protein, unknown function [Babesia microti strain RI]|uniref:Uncharacterized protein n=1 Tax=Babesia microti (strain RI) TaxID=1133968 RepID=I7IFL4_BABMR|nr:conserved Plasmodium protein, unknown function [Babesia microti strain RI]CCF72921.1 conserved Plasmodium protein, unknown function [Babesia microti strain RI]|eukprot:XP_012647530.1 conserved Plasmodium protein, unknown function [Babesia microti strain RI]